MKTVSIIIPVFNEESNIVSVIESVLSSDTLGLKKEIIIVDDGSTDNTKLKVESLKSKVEKILQAKVQLISFPENKGKGAALKAGFKRASGDILLVQDADKEYSLKDYPALIKPFFEKDTAVVYGSRNKKRENFHNRYSYFSFFVGGLFLTWFVNFVYRISLTDQPTGYKLFSSKLKSLLIAPSENRFSYEVAVTAGIAKRNIPFVEVPIHYKPRTMQEGKKINALDFIESIFVAIKYRFTN